MFLPPKMISNPISSVTGRRNSRANASLAFDNKREDNLQEKLARRTPRKRNMQKVGQLTMQVDWLKKKNLKKLSDLTHGVNLVRTFRRLGNTCIMEQNSLTLIAPAFITMAHLFCRRTGSVKQSSIICILIIRLGCSSDVSTAWVTWL